MNADDLILISVDDHICEPADMFDAHVPGEVPRPRAAGRRRGRRRRSSGGTATSGAATSGSTRSPASRREMFNVDASRYDEMRPGCYDVARARARHERRRPARRAELPELDRLLGPGAEPGPRPRRQPRDDQGVQRLARRRVVRRLSRTASSRAGSCRCSTSSEAAEEVRRLADKGCHAVTFSENPDGARACRRSTPTRGTRCSPRAATPARCCAATSARRRRARTTVDRRARRRADDPVVGDGDLHARRSAVGRLLAPVPRRCEFSLTEGDIGWIPYFLQRAEHIARPPLRLDAARVPARAGGPTRAVPRAHPVLLHRGPRRRASCSTSSTSTTCAGSRDYPHSDSSWPNAPEALAELLADLDDEIVNKITHENAMRHYQFDPFAHPAAGAVHGRRAAGRVARRRHRHPRRPAGRRARPRGVAEADHGPPAAAAQS